MDCDLAPGDVLVLNWDPSTGDGRCERADYWHYEGASGRDAGGGPVPQARDQRCDALHMKIEIWRH